MEFTKMQDKEVKYSPKNEMKHFLNKIKQQLEKQSKREAKPRFHQEAQLIFRTENFKYELEELEEVLIDL